MMSVVSFDELLGLVNENIAKRDTILRKSIIPAERLVVTLRNTLPVNASRGDPQYRIPKLEPLGLDEIKIDQGSGPVQLSLTGKDVKVHGLSHVVLKSIKFDSDSKLLDIGFTIDKVIVLAKYDISGKVLVLPITGTGDLNITLEGPDTLDSHGGDEGGGRFLTSGEFWGGGGGAFGRGAGGKKRVGGGEQTPSLPPTPQTPPRNCETLIGGKQDVTPRRGNATSYGTFDEDRMKSLEGGGGGGGVQWVETGDTSMPLISRLPFALWRDRIREEKRALAQRGTSDEKLPLHLLVSLDCERPRRSALPGYMRDTACFPHVAGD
uniref:Uncharacterized protein n=1 Tax=Timema cristinae TaxID=61476 RepID=A0A7R9DG26_TIMCR|nr:unnamed protein product [Timema cristinae]